MALPAWALKSICTALTAGSTMLAASFVGGHVKNATAPLHPTVAPGSSPVAAQLAAVLQIGPPADAGGSATLDPSVRPMDPNAVPVTSTYVS